MSIYAAARVERNHARAAMIKARKARKAARELPKMLSIERNKARADGRNSAREELTRRIVIGPEQDCIVLGERPDNVWELVRFCSRPHQMYLGHLDFYRLCTDSVQVFTAEFRFVPKAWVHPETGVVVRWFDREPVR